MTKPYFGFPGNRNGFTGGGLIDGTLAPVNGPTIILKVDPLHGSAQITSDVGMSVIVMANILLHTACSLLDGACQQEKMIVGGPTGTQVDEQTELEKKPETVVEDQTKTKTDPEG